MEYPKPVMRMSELKKMGFPEEYLLRAYRTRGQAFAFKVHPEKSNSPIMFDTAGFNKWHLKNTGARR